MNVRKDATTVEKISKVGGIGSKKNMEGKLKFIKVKRENSKRK